MKPARPGIFGKLPAKGDFLARDLPPQLLQAWEGWLQEVIRVGRDIVGPAWGEAWASAPAWRFWIGPDVFGMACAGAMVPSRDHVGRLFPFAFILPDRGQGFPPPPVVAPFEGWYARLEARLAEALALQELPEVEALLDGLSPDEAPVLPVLRLEEPQADIVTDRVPEGAQGDTPALELAEAGAGEAEEEVPQPGDAHSENVAPPSAEGGPEAEPGPASQLQSASEPELEMESASGPQSAPEPQAEPEPPLWPPLPRRDEDPLRALWATAGGADPVALLSDAAGADHYRAAAGRSYWWTTGGRSGQAAMIALSGLPDASAFALLLRGGRA